MGVGTGVGVGVGSALSSGSSDASGLSLGAALEATSPMTSSLGEAGSSEVLPQAARAVSISSASARAVMRAGKLQFISLLCFRIGHAMQKDENESEMFSKIA